MNVMDNIAHHRKQQMRRYHQARWDEPVIFELSQPGERGILVPEVEPDIVRAAGQPLAGLPLQCNRAGQLFFGNQLLFDQQLTQQRFILIVC